MVGDTAIESVSSGNRLQASCLLKPFVNRGYSSQRRADGSWARATLMTAMWSVAVLDPALPGRSSTPYPHRSDPLSRRYDLNYEPQKSR